MKEVQPNIEGIYGDEAYPYGKRFVKYEEGDSFADIYNQGYLPISVKESYEDGPIFDLNRSVRIDISKFELNSENRRIMRKTEYLDSQVFKLIGDEGEEQDFEYDAIKAGKFCHDNFKLRFPENPMHISRIKRIFTGGIYNRFFVYFDGKAEGKRQEAEVINDMKIVGYTATLMRDNILHYAHPFNDQDYYRQNIGMGMMLRALIWAKEKGLDFVYLGTCNTVPSLYKLQFKGVEWFDGNEWVDDVARLKDYIRSQNES